jgi:hypothetical protein
MKIIPLFTSFGCFLHWWDIDANWCSKSVPWNFLSQHLHLRITSYRICQWRYTVIKSKSSKESLFFYIFVENCRDASVHWWDIDAIWWSKTVPWNLSISVYKHTSIYEPVNGNIQWIIRKCIWSFIIFQETKDISRLVIDLDERFVIYRQRNIRSLHDDQWN